MHNPADWRQDYMPNPLPRVLRDARAFIADCTDTIAVSRTSDQSVILIVHRNCEGGWDGFVRSDQTVDAELVKSQIMVLYGEVWASMIYPNG